MNSFTNPVENLRKLVAFRSVSHMANLDLCDFVANACASLGFDCTLEKDRHSEKANVIATIGPKVPGGIILSGHLDVVPTEGQPWSSDPFALTERQGRLFGRGTSDMKGFIASTLCALTKMDLARIRKPIVLIWTYDEEIGCRGSAEFARNHASLPSWYPTEALIGEPTDLRIFRMHPGHVSFKITIKGKAAHSSKPDLGVSAIKCASKILQLLEVLETELSQERRLQAYLERPFVVLNVGMIKGGQAINIVPDKCEIDVGYRPLPGDDPKAVLIRFQERLFGLNIPDVEVQLQNITPSLLTDDGTPLSHLLRPHAHGDIGAASFATDGGNFSALGIQALIFGPGSIDVAHRADEYIETAALTKAPSILSDILTSRCE